MDLSIAERLRLNLVQGMPRELLSTTASDLWHHLPGPTVFRIEGLRPEPLFVSVLLHGNETTGWEAVKSVLNRYQDRQLPRTLLLFVGNVEAAREGVRTRSGQTDYNRAWPGTPSQETAETWLMQEVFEHLKSQSLFASIDIHNNTGHNPHYACLNRLAEPNLHLARLFSRTVVFFERPLGVQSAALSRLCPAVTVECGLSGGREGVMHAAEFIEAALSLDHFPEHPVPEGDLDLMQTDAIIKVPAGVGFSFDGGAAELMLRGDIDRLNFSELRAGVSFGRLGGNQTARLEVEAGGPNSRCLGYFSYDGGEIRLARRAIPAMLTRDPMAVRLDCLGYLMHRIGRDGSPLDEA